jgi:hypothetical protein
LRHRAFCAASNCTAPFWQMDCPKEKSGRR